MKREKINIELIIGLIVLVTVFIVIIVGIVVSSKNNQRIQDCLKPFAEKACEEKNSLLQSIYLLAPYKITCKSNNLDPRDPTEQTFELKFLDEEVERCLK